MSAHYSNIPQSERHIPSNELLMTCIEELERQIQMIKRLLMGGVFHHEFSTAGGERRTAIYMASQPASIPDSQRMGFRESEIAHICKTCGSKSERRRVQSDDPMLTLPIKPKVLDRSQVFSLDHIPRVTRSPKYQDLRKRWDSQFQPSSPLKKKTSLDQFPRITRSPKYQDLRKRKDIQPSRPSKKKTYTPKFPSRSKKKTPKNTKIYWEKEGEDQKNEVKKDERLLQRKFGVEGLFEPHQLGEPSHSTINSLVRVSNDRVSNDPSTISPNQFQVPGRPRGMFTGDVDSPRINPSSRTCIKKSQEILDEDISTETSVEFLRKETPSPSNNAGNALPEANGRVDRWGKRLD